MNKTGLNIMFCLKIKLPECKSENISHVIYGQLPTNPVSLII